MDSPPTQPHNRGLSPADVFLASISQLSQLDRIERLLIYLLRAQKVPREPGGRSGAADLLDKLASVGEAVDVAGANDRSALRVTARRRGWIVTIAKVEGGMLRVTAMANVEEGVAPQTRHKLERLARQGYFVEARSNLVKVWRRGHLANIREYTSLAAAPDADEIAGAFQT